MNFVHQQEQGSFAVIGLHKMTIPDKSKSEPQEYMRIKFYGDRQILCITFWSIITHSHTFCSS